MARNRKNKIFDLFKSSFQITFFHKPSNDNDFYYIVLDDAIEIRLKVINDIAVIDMVFPITQSYITLLYHKLVVSLMHQDNVTVLVSTILNTNVIHQFCIKQGAPLIEAESYITVSREMYDRLKNQYNDLNRYGFYILAVSDEKPLVKKKKEPTVVDVPRMKESVPEIESNVNSKFEPIKDIFIKNIEGIEIVQLKPEIIECNLNGNKFLIEWVDDSLYIKDLFQTDNIDMNLIGKMNLLGTFEKLIPIVPNIYIVSIQNMELYRICLTKKYELISEDNKLPINKLFKQAFLGYGTYKIIIN